MVHLMALGRPPRPREASVCPLDNGGLIRVRWHTLQLGPTLEGPQSAKSGRSVNHSNRHGVIRGIQRGTAARNASYSLPNVCSSVGSSYATTKTWKKSQSSAP